jgi:hypothetical protein
MREEYSPVAASGQVCPKNAYKFGTALATEARRAATGNTDAVHEGAGPQDNAQSDPAINAATGGQQ